MGGGPGARGQVLDLVTGTTCDPTAGFLIAEEGHATSVILEAVVISHELVDKESFKELSIAISANGR